MCFTMTAFCVILRKRQPAGKRQAGRFLADRGAAAMNERNDFSDIGNRIKGAIQDAVGSGDFGQLNEVINGTINGALDEVRRQAGQAGNGTGRRMPRYPRGGPKETGYQTAQAYEREDGTTVYRTPSLKNVKNRIFYKNGKVSGILLTVFGGVATGVFGITALVLLTVWLVTAGAVLSGPAIVFSVLAAAGVLMLWQGCRIRKRLARAERYLKLAGEEMYIWMHDLAARTGVSEKKLRRQLRSMIRDGFFPEGHMDGEGSIFVLNDETWGQYLEERREHEAKQLAEREKAEQGSRNAQAAQPDSREQEDSPEREAQRRLEQEGHEYMQQLRELNLQIPGEIISNKLYQLDYLLNRIFAALREHPEKSAQMRRFMEYYLPTTVKLVESYAEFDRAGVEGENIKKAKSEIEKTMDTIISAFEKVLDDLYQDAAFEAAADAKVLKTILAQDGYAEHEFKVSDEKEGI